MVAEMERAVLEAGLRGSCCATAGSTGPAPTTPRTAHGGGRAPAPLPGGRQRRRLFSFIHVDDAAAATVAAVERGAPGIYNVVDDEPAAMRDWLPVYAEAIGAKPPRRVPVWLARLVAGRHGRLA